MKANYDVYMCREKSELQKMIEINERNTRKQWEFMRENIRAWCIANPMVIKTKSPN
jgi:hypothetical protein